MFNIYNSGKPALAGYNVAVNSLVVNDSIVVKNIDVNGNVHISGNALIDGDTTVDSDFSVTGNAIIDGSATVGNGLAVTGNSSITTGDLSVQGDITARSISFLTTPSQSQFNYYYFKILTLTVRFEDGAEVLRPVYFTRIGTLCFMQIPTCSVQLDNPVTMNDYRSIVEAIPSEVRPISDRNFIYYGRIGATDTTLDNNVSRGTVTSSGNIYFYTYLDSSVAPADGLFSSLEVQVINWQL